MDVDDDDKSTMASTADGEKRQLLCQGCHEPFQASQLLLGSVEDWCGGLDCRCMKCSNWTGTPQAFKRVEP